MTRIPRRLSLVALASLAGTSACSLFWSTSDFTSHDDADAIAQDGGDAGGAVSGDGGGPGEGGSPSEGGAPAFCTGLAPSPTFCVDFDTTKSPPGLELWGSNAPAPVVDPGSGTTGDALLATIPTTTECTSNAEWSGGGTFTKYKATFSIRVASEAPSYTQVYSFLFKAGATVHRILVANNQGMLDWIQELDYAGGTTFASIPLNGATGYVPVSFEGTCASKSLSVTVAGKTTTQNLATAPSGSCAQANLRFGVYYNAATQKAKKVWVDDVALWLE